MILHEVNSSNGTSLDEFFNRNKSTGKGQIVEILIHSSIENFQPGL